MLCSQQTSCQFCNDCYTLEHCNGKLLNHSYCLQDDPRFAIADPICTFVFALLVLLTTRSLLRDISDTLMERVPRGLDADAMQAKLEEASQILLVDIPTYFFPVGPDAYYSITRFHLARAPQVFIDCYSLCIWGWHTKTGVQSIMLIKMLHE